MRFAIGDHVTWSNHNPLPSPWCGQVTRIIEDSGNHYTQTAIEVDWFAPVDSWYVYRPDELTIYEPVATVSYRKAAPP